MSTNITSKCAIKNKQELFDQVMAAILKSGEQGVFQTEICKEFSLDSRDGSRLAGNLEKQSRISREKVLYKGRWTYKLIVRKPSITEDKKKPVTIDCVKDAPCFRCSFEHSCSSEDESTPNSPWRCALLETWVTSSFIKSFSDN